MKRLAIVTAVESAGATKTINDLLQETTTGRRPKPALQTGSHDEPPEREAAAQLVKGPLSGVVPGGGGEPTTATGVPAGSAVPFGLPGGALAGDGASPTLVFGGFSMMLVPMKGMSMANMASMLSAGQQLGQMVPKPGGGGGS